MVDGVSERLFKIRVDIHIKVISTSSDHAEGEFEIVQLLNAFVVGMNFHQEETIRQALTYQLAERCRIDCVLEPINEVIAMFAGSTRRAHDEGRSGRIIAGFSNGEQKGQQVAAFAGQPARK